MLAVILLYSCIGCPLSENHHPEPFIAILRITTPCRMQDKATSDKSQKNLDFIQGYL
jgi:hypothetical protein